MLVKYLDVHLWLVGVARDASCFRRLDLGKLSPEEAFQVQVKEEAAMVSENDLVEGIDASLVDEGKKSGGETKT